ncbi:hypothetical protein K2173_012515 [Erythroxylum novogranatense]|uniref:Uncharacterized protein n=1 Tax=Erythroxylum novogranatense TaxID=1862640 RepID=A0AAV8TJD6_9ROSI|nr:hypothetical protein K2173_012515 [Erythroxylum novogranatense]
MRFERREPAFLHLHIHWNRVLVRLWAFLAKPMMLISLLIALVSIVGIVGASCKCPKVTIGYIVSLLILAVLLFAFTMFALVVTGRGSGDKIPGRNYEEYSLGRYNVWFEKRVNSTKTWKHIRTCMETTQVCTDFSKKFANVTQRKFFNLPLTPIQAGCCKPSDKCGFTYIHPTEWNVTGGGDYKNNPDCLAWNNKSNVFCFNCNSCKAGLVDQMRRFFRINAMVDLFFVGSLVIACGLGFYEIRAMREEEEEEEKA